MILNERKYRMLMCVASLFCACIRGCANASSNLDDLRFSRIQRKSVSGTSLENDDNFSVEWRVSFDADSSNSSLKPGIARPPCFLLSVLGTLNGLLYDEIHGQPKLVCLDTDYLWEGTRFLQCVRDNPLRPGKNVFMIHLVTLMHREVANATVAFEARSECLSWSPFA